MTNIEPSRPLFLQKKKESYICLGVNIARTSILLAQIVHQLCILIRVALRLLYYRIIPGPGSVLYYAADNMRHMSPRGKARNYAQQIH